MKSLTFEILGATSFLIGCVFVLNSFFGVTGFIIAEFVGKRTGSLIGLAFIIIGILLFLRGRLEHSLDLFKSRGIITDPKKLKKVAGRIIKQRGYPGREVKEGYQILDKNYSSRISTGPKTGEVDIVAKKDDIISFIEVKTLRQAQGEPFLPEEKVNFGKQRKLVKTAESWLMKKKIPLNSKWQIDVIAIELNLNKKAKINHFENAIPYC